MVSDHSSIPGPNTDATYLAWTRTVILTMAPMPTPVTLAFSALVIVSSPRAHQDAKASRLSGRMSQNKNASASGNNTTGPIYTRTSWHVQQDLVGLTSLLLSVLDRCSDHLMSDVSRTKPPGSPSDYPDRNDTHLLPGAEQWHNGPTRCCSSAVCSLDVLR